MKDMADGLFSVEAEQQILGAMLTNNELLSRISAFLKEEHFYDPIHATLYGRMLDEIHAGRIASPVTMASKILDLDMGDIGGRQYLVRMAGSAVSSSAVKDYADTVIEFYVKRVMQEHIQRAQTDLYSKPVREVQSDLNSFFYSLPDQFQGGTVSAVAAITSAMEETLAYYKEERHLIRTGVSELDKIIGGLAPGDLMLLGGSTSMGKTTCALHIAKMIAKERSVAFWSREMRESELIARMISSECGIAYSKARNASELAEDEMRKWANGSKKLADLHFDIIPKRTKRIRDARSDLARLFDMNRDAPPAMLVVDYAQIVEAEGRTRYEQMSSIPTQLKDLGGEFGIPVVALVQLDRNLGNRPDPRPQLSDIKESGQFENDADQAVFCHREEYWLMKRGPELSKDGTVTMDARADFEADMARHKNRMELIVRKNRHGPLASAEVGAHMPTNRIWSIQDEQEGL
jgi:replicative DNA helicase